MKDKNYLVALKWIEKADKDLEITKLLIKKKGYLDYASFHLQQSFEKYLKAYLAYKGLFPERTHDLEKLLNRSAKYNLNFLKHLDLARELSPFAVLPRYPDEVPLPSSPTFKKLVKSTEKFRDFIKEIIIKVV